VEATPRSAEKRGASKGVKLQREDLGQAHAGGFRERQIGFSVPKVLQLDTHKWNVIKSAIKR
jgi:hypothetical protein